MNIVEWQQRWWPVTCMTDKCADRLWHSCGIKIAIHTHSIYVTSHAAGVASTMAKICLKKSQQLRIRLKRTPTRCHPLLTSKTILQQVNSSLEINSRNAVKIMTFVSQYSSSSSSFGMHHQCVALLAANSLHSGLFRASSIASSKVRLCWASSFFRVAIQEV